MSSGERERRWSGCLAAISAAALCACAHGDVRGRETTFTAFVRSLSPCPPQLSAPSAGDIAGGLAPPGSRMSARGYLAVVAFGPPCPGDPANPRSHCGLTWSLWGSTNHPREFDDSVSGGVILLAGAALPSLVDQRDVEAARSALADINVTISGTVPDHICDPEDGTLMGKAPCRARLRESTVDVTAVCRVAVPVTSPPRHP